MPANNRSSVGLTEEPEWYKDAIIYELHVRAFYDSDGDGIGDFRGLTEKLDYLQDLGITAIWLLPFFPSPLKDDGYDIADYKNVHPAYGTLRDFKEFVREAHRRGLRVLTELVLNHTSDQHPWFQRARRARKGSNWRNFYVWTNNPDSYPGVRIIFQDFESSNWAWDPLARAYYWHRFYSHQPDLNFDNPLVRRKVMGLLDFWLKLGVDGLRLDAVPYLFEREGTNCENLPETHEFLKELRSHVDRNFKDRMLLAEANQWPEDAAAYFGNGDECHMAFHFPIMPRLFIALRMEDRYPIINSLEQTPTIPDNSQWAIFLRNHDELTLEMVTDEERDYMYRVYAQDRQARINLGIRRRLAPLMGNSRRKIELMNNLLFSLPGTPVIYYGDEIGMGDNIYLGDRDGVRTPMQWSADRNAGFSRANPQGLYLPPIIDQEYHYEALNVEVQQNNPESLLSWTKRVIALRRNYRAFGRGTIEFLYPENGKILAFIRRYKQECILVVANFSRLLQYAELNLSEFKGMIPVTPYGRLEFPPIGEAPYFVTMGPHSFMWFSLDPSKQDQITAYSSGSELPVIQLSGHWTTLLEKESRPKLEALLPGFLVGQRWFRSKNRRIRGTRISELIWSGKTKKGTCLAIVQLEYAEGDPETYLVPMSFATGEHADTLIENSPHAVICRISFKGDHAGLLYDSTVDPEFASLLLKLMERQQTWKGSAGELTARNTRAFRTLTGRTARTLEPTIMTAEQTNTSIRFENRFVLKIYRRLEEGMNSEIEIGRFLAKRGFPFVPPLAGELEYIPRAKRRREPIMMAVLHGWIPNQADAWKYTLDVLSQFIEEMMARRPGVETLQTSRSHLLDMAFGETPAMCYDLIGSYLESARLLGERTAQLHITLAAEDDDKNFKPDKFTLLYQRSLYQSLINLSEGVFQLLEQKLKRLPEETVEEATTLLNMQEDVQARFRSVLEAKFNAVRIRCHGDLHLRQILYTGNDFVIMDFEGDANRSLSERRIKRSPLRDVAGMIRSFEYASYSALFFQQDAGLMRGDDRRYAESLIGFWNLWVQASFLKAYLEIAEGDELLPDNREELRTMLDVFILEKAVYELGHELNNRPNWVKIPLQGIRRILSFKAGETSAGR